MVSKKKKIRSPTQEKRKQERTKTQASKKYILACLSTFLSLLSNMLYFFNLTYPCHDFLLPFPFSIFIFSKHVHTKMLFFSFIYEILLCLSN